MLLDINPETLGAQIEDALYNTRDVDYIKTGRSLIFNLKDASNSALRSRIFSKELPLPQLVCLSF
jgi:hypothetical protein